MMRHFFSKHRPPESARRRGCRGVTIVETVIAMAVIIIVSVTAISSVQHALRFTGEAELGQQARQDAVNALECFKFAENQWEFEENLPVKADSAEWDTAKGSVTYIYRYGVVYYTEICVSYGLGGQHDTFTASCYGETNKRVFHLDYEKG